MTIEVHRCDNCEGACDEPHGDPDIAWFCCLCMAEAERPYVKQQPELCDACERRKGEGK